MKSKLAVTALIVAAFTAPTLALAQDRDANRDQPKTFVKDSVITTKIKAKLATERLSSLAKIHVDTEENGKVWLSGSANSQEQIDKAVAIARATENVSTVENRLTVKKDD